MDIRRLAAALLVAIVALETARAAPACERDSKMTYWESSSLAPEFRHGILLGASESEFLRFTRKAAAAKEVVFFKDKDWTGPGAPLYVVDERLKGRRELGVQQVFLFDGGELALLLDQVQDGYGTTEISRGDANAILADYARYMCWRFGALKDRSSMGAKTRAALVGPAQIYEQVGAGNDRIEMDAFLVESVGKPDRYGVQIVTRLARFGRE